MRTQARNRILRSLSTGLVLTAVLVLGAPDAARAEDGHLRGVTIDGRGVHFDFGRGYQYLHVNFPHARHYFAANEHYRKAQRLEGRRHEWIQKAEHYLVHGNFDRALRAFEKARRAETRRQRQLRRLDRDRARFERGHRHHREHARAHHQRWRGWRD